MKILVTITFFVALAVTCSMAKGPQLHLEMSEVVFYDEVLKGSCTVQGSIIPPHVSVVMEDRSNCKLDITSKERAPKFRTHFVLKHITGSCTVRCFSGRSKIVKTVTPIINETKITTEPHNTTVHSGMPVTVSCTVKSNDLLYHQLLWMKGDVFVGIDDNHSLWFSQHDSDTKTCELTVHSVTESAPYTCMLMSTDGKVVSSVTQYVFAEELDDSEVSETLQYLSQFFKWHV
ncbi:uncharacterized protein [Dysidea avara]|uniref:uncharacterized protein isoform X1 n=2 Tax=Dysidea avara TaxID=196820 RepID=UPI0033171679